VLALAGAALGIALSLFGLRALSAWAVSDVVGFPYFFQFQLDARALGLTLSLALGIALLASIAPALMALRLAPRVTLQAAHGGGSGARLSRLMRVLVIAEVALSTAALVGSGVAVKSLWGLGR